MKFMLMMHAPKGTGDWAILGWKKEALEAHMNFMRDLNKDLKEAGEFVTGEGLTPPGQARIVRMGDGTKPEVSDGPFAESKEFLAGYWIIDVESKERAYAIAGRISGAPDKDGKPFNMAVEVREVMGNRPHDA